MNRDQAYALVSEHTKSESLIRHMLAVETCVRWYAQHLGENVDSWALAGLLHDFDYEAHPSEHPNWGIELLRGTDCPKEVIQAIAAHAPDRTGVTPESKLDRYLFACDELAGLITAVVYVRPSKSILDVEVKSVLKKFKEASFAAGVNRDDVRHGAELIGLPLDEHVANMITAMKANAESLGLQGVAVS